MRTVTIANHKGGVGKTTTAYTLGAGLRAKGYKVLLIDLDPQTNLAYTANVEGEESYRLSEVFKGEQKTADCIFQIKADLEDFDILVGGKNFLNADAIYNQTDLLEKALKGIKDHYDYIVIDTPPNLGILTKNAIKISDDLIIPLKADVYSLQGLGAISTEIELGAVNAKALLIGVNERTNLSKFLLGQIKKQAKDLGIGLYKTMIRNSVSIPESQLKHKSIMDYAPSAKVTQDYKDFIAEYMKGVKYASRTKK